MRKPGTRSPIHSRLSAKSIGKSFRLEYISANAQDLIDMDVPSLPLQCQGSA
jgi:hypothetical protein